MTRAALVFVVLLGAAAVGCEDDTRGLDGGPLDTGVTVDSGPTELPPCEGYLWTLDADGLVVRVPSPSPCARGAICGTGTDYAICSTASEEIVDGRGGDLAPSTIERARLLNPNYPFCVVDADCGIGSICLYQAGCPAPEAFCCQSATCSGNAILPITHCRQVEGCQIEYCGCDGRTFEGVPTQPYAYPGPCR